MLAPRGRAFISVFGKYPSRREKPVAYIQLAIQPHILFRFRLGPGASLEHRCIRFLVARKEKRVRLPSRWQAPSGSFSWSPRRNENDGEHRGDRREAPKGLHGSQAVPPEKLDPGDDDSGTPDHNVERFCLTQPVLPRQHQRSIYLFETRTVQ